MKILMTIPYLASVYGGPSKVVKDLANNLGNRGIEVDLITTNAGGHTKLDVPINCWIERDGYSVQFFNCFHQYDFVLSASLGRWMAKNVANYDVVHTHNMFAPAMAIACWICRKQNIPYVTTPHGMLEPWALSYKASKKSLYYKHVEIPLLKSASAIHVLNDLEESNVNTLGFPQTTIIHNGIHRKTFEAHAKPDLLYQKFPDIQNKKIILFLGRIDPKKGLDLLAPAFATAKARFPNIHLIVAGPDSTNFLPTAQSYFAQENCLEAVTFTGMLMGELKRAVLAAADIYIAPSYSEGFSMSVLEGMATGLPCIITTGCNFPEAAIAKAAHVVETNSQAIASALVQCLQDETGAKALGRRAKGFVLKNYTWEQSAEKLSQVYSSIVKST